MQVVEAVVEVEERLDVRRPGVERDDVQGERVDREVAATEVGLERIAPFDGRLARVIDVGLRTKRRDLDLDGAVAKQPANRPEGPSLLPHRGAERGHQRHDVIRARIRREVDLEFLGPFFAENRVAHRTSDGVEAEARVGERAGHGTRQMR